MSEGKPARELVLDTSVAVKFYLPEEGREEVLVLLAAVGEGEAKLLAPSTVQPELFNALWQQHRREKLSREEVGEHWGDFSVTSIDLYAPEDLMPSAAQIALETGIIIYDALFLALAEDAESVMVTADERLLKALRDTAYANLARHLRAVGELLQ
ncbi:MAG: type II toxin-antitoxin system VapC family toxin [Rubrobacteraceae bacterium]|nr:type II toxin-antitoxin system VapC family toxin [Rubrobacteraceae bacterium]MDQ3437813.1 type II toxin-antitoxin system VapC family toxin [Actinomycetota bacterium]